MAVLRYILMSFLAIALTVGTGWQSCATVKLQASAPMIPIGEMASHQTMGHHDHQHHQMMSVERDDAQAAAPSNVVDQSGDSHACLKCCGACMLGGVVMTAPEWTVTRAAARVTFMVPNEQLRGQIVFIDPDIPKSVA